MAKRKKEEIEEAAKKLRKDLEPLYARLEEIKRDLYETFERSHNSY